MAKRTRRPTEPGEILKEFYLESRGISITAFSEAVGCSRKHMSQIVNGNSRIEAKLAARIGEVLGTSAELWLNLQNKVDLFDAQQSLKNWKPKQRFPAEVS
jgi:addiction module HigA family antidote